jgi:hypothetical protein
MKNSVTLHLCGSEVVNSKLCVGRTFRRVGTYGDSKSLCDYAKLGHKARHDQKDVSRTTS